MLDPTAHRLLTLAAGALALLGAAACGSADPQQTLEQLASSAATAQLTVLERASGAIPQRYASQMLEKAAAEAAQGAQEIDQSATLPHDAKSRALLLAMQVSSTASRAARDTALQQSAAQTLDSLARDAQWLAEHATPQP